MSKIIIISIFTSLILVNCAFSEDSKLENASMSELNSAKAHFIRSRALIISAIREFDIASKIASPESLIDMDAWRNGLIDRAEDLERILDPQPRSTKGGVYLDGEPRLLKDSYK